MEIVADTYEYSTKDLIGHGAFAVVYRGRYIDKPENPVAIKCITKKNIAKSQSLLAKEIKILQELTELHHENVVALYHCHETSNNVFLIMEYCNGGDLADFLQVKGTLSESTIKLFLRQLADAMKALTNKGIVHRDLKPQNILLAHSGKPNPSPHQITLKIVKMVLRDEMPSRVDPLINDVVNFWAKRDKVQEFGSGGAAAAASPLLSNNFPLDLCHTPDITSKDVRLEHPFEEAEHLPDFGFARFLQDGVMAATLCGSPMYMAPEVIMSLQYDAKADLWSLGTIVFQCLTGKAPFHAQTPQALKNYYEKNANLAPRIPPGTSEGLSQLLRGLLKRNARERMGFEEFFNNSFIRGGDIVGATPSKEPTTGHTSAPVIRTPSTMAAAPKTPHAPGNGGAIRPPSAPSPPAGQLPPSPETLEMSIEQQKPSQEFYLACTSPASAGVNPPTARTNLNPSPPLCATPVPRRSSPHNRQILNVAQQSGQEDTEDFVMVPSGIPSDNDPSRGRIGRITPTGRRASSASPVHGKVAFSPLTPQIPPSTRPSQLAVSGSGGSASTQSSESGGGGDSNFRCSEPLPVPNHKETFMRMTSMGSSDLVPALVESTQNSQATSSDSVHGGGATQNPRSQPINVQRRFSEHKAPDIASLSPPSVQFAIGTPPMGYRRRSSSCSSYSSTPPNPGYCGGIVPGGRLTPTNSPLRQSGRRTPPHFPPQAFCSPPGLPPILGSPNKIPYNTLGQQDNMVGDICGNHPPTTAPPFCGPNRTRTLPELSPCHHNTVASGDVSMEGSGLQRSRTESHIFIASPPVNNSRQMVQYGQSMQGFLVHPAPGFHNLGVNAMDPPEVMNFYAPPLNQETIMEKEHNETLAKLNFVVALVDCVLELAQSRASVFSSFTRSTTMRDSTSGSPKDIESSSLVTPIPEWQRKTEQLVLYIRALQLSSSALTLAKEEKIKDNLKPSNAVKSVVALLNQKFRLALSVCKELSSSGNIIPVDARASTINADKLIYNYAIEMCQNAALDELFGKPEDCFRRYQTAQILLHALAQQVSHESDKTLLVKYKQAVEKRLFLLQEQGVVHAYSTSDAEL